MEITYEEWNRLTGEKLNPMRHPSVVSNKTQTLTALKTMFFLIMKH